MFAISFRPHSRCHLLPLIVLTTGLTWASAGSARPAQRHFELEPCHLDRVADWVLCGTFAVPEDHAAPQGRQLELRVAILPAFTQPAEPDPVFLLAGGPGQSAVGLAASVHVTLGEANHQRDVVLVDQRGTGGSSPLECALDFDADAFDQEAKSAAIGKCLAELDADPSRYGTMSHVRDLEAVRRALGYERINLYGASYGTRVAQVYMREFPQYLETVVMDGVVPMGMRIGLEMGAAAQLTLDAVFDRCASDANCAERFPEPRRQFEELLDELAEHPRELELNDAATGNPVSTPMDHRRFSLGLRAWLHSPQTQRLVPLLIDQAANDDWEGMVGLASSFNASLRELMTPALLLAVLCTEDLADVSPADISEEERASFVGSAYVDELLGYCAAWPGTARRVDWTPPLSDTLPVLLLSGALDPATPPHRAEEAAATLGNSRHVVVAAGGHIVGGMGCIPELIDQFITTRDPQGLDVSCVDDIVFPSFFVNSMGPTP